MTSLVSHTSVDCRDAYALSEFWREVLGYDHIAGDPNEPGDQECMVRDPRTGHQLLFIEVPDPTPGKNRLHLDLRPRVGTRDQEVERLLALGASLVADRRTGDGGGWATLADPEGNQFCVLRSDRERGVGPTADVLPREIPTKRLVLRAAGPDDASAQVEAIADSVAELSHWMPWCRGPQALAQARANLVEAARAFDAGQGFEYVMWLDGVFVGRIGVHSYDPGVKKGEIGYWARTPYTGRGLVQEAVRALTQATVEAGFRRVEIRCDAANLASARVAEACGYTLDARLVNAEVSVPDPSVLRDTLIWSVTR